MDYKIYRSQSYFQQSVACIKRYKLTPIGNILFYFWKQLINISTASMIKKGLFLFLVLILAGCNSRKIVLADCREEVKKSLESLLSRENDDAFVIFSESKTDKYCQFTRLDKGLLFDLPFLPLSKKELQRARVILAKYEVFVTQCSGSNAIYLSLNENIDRSSWNVFQKDMGNDIDTATKIVIDIFKNIYQIPPDTPIIIEEN